ncbi:MAG: hypothetical protein ACLUSP_00655 [Christensenellales bacterium]
MRSPFRNRSDGAVFICSSDVADAGMRMFNADGSEGQTCGNARCVAKYLSDYGGVEKIVSPSKRNPEYAE